VILDEQQIDRNLCEKRQFRTELNSVYASQGRRAAFRASMTGSALSNLDFTWQIRPAIGPAVISDNLRIIGPFFFMYEAWPLGERQISMLGIDDILPYVSHRFVLQPEGLSLAWPLQDACINPAGDMDGRPSRTSRLPSFEPARPLKMLDSGIALMSRLHGQLST
jgi:hypothetical protein